MENSSNRIKLTLVSELAPVVKQVADWIANVTSSQMPELRAGFKSAALALVDGLDLAIKDTSNLLIIGHEFSQQFEQGVLLRQTLLDRLTFKPLKDGAALFGGNAGNGDDFTNKINRLRDGFLSASKLTRDALNGGGLPGGTGDGKGTLFDFEGQRSWPKKPSDWPKKPSDWPKKPSDWPKKPRKSSKAHSRRSPSSMSS